MAGSKLPPSPPPVARSMARSTLSTGTLSLFAADRAFFRARLVAGSPPPPERTAAWMARMCLLINLPRCWSSAPFLRFICDHLLWPAKTVFLHGCVGALFSSCALLCRPLYSTRRPPRTSARGGCHPAGFYRGVPRRCSADVKAGFQHVAHGETAHLELDGRVPLAVAGAAAVGDVAGRAAGGERRPHVVQTAGRTGAVDHALTAGGQIVDAALHGNVAGEHVDAAVGVYGREGYVAGLVDHEAELDLVAYPVGGALPAGGAELLDDVVECYVDAADAAGSDGDGAGGNEQRYQRCGYR